MRRENLAVMRMPLKVEQIQGFFFRSKERSDKFQQILESEGVKEDWEKTKIDIANTQSKIFSFKDVKKEDIFRESESVLRLRYAAEIFSNSIDKLIGSQEKRTLEEIMLDEINSESMRRMISEISEENSFLSLLIGFFE